MSLRRLGLEFPCSGKGNQQRHMREGNQQTTLAIVLVDLKATLTYLVVAFRFDPIIGTVEKQY
jgi:hypothetical protein